MKMRHIYFVGSLVLVALQFAGCGKAPEPAVDLDTVSRPAMILTIDAQAVSSAHYSGTLRAAQRAELAFKRAGKLASMPVQEGEQVQAQQILATLDDTELTIALNSARAEFKQAQADFERGSKIFESTQAISKSDLEKLSVKRDLAENKVSQAEQDLANASLRAPFAGVIAQKMVSNFSNVQANQAIYVLHNPTDLEMVIHVPAKRFLEPNRGRFAVAEIDGLPGQRFNLTFRYYASAADPVAQTYQVVLGVDDPSGANLLPGMTAKVYPLLQETGQAQTIFVPVDAVLPSNTGSQFVWLVNAENKVEPRTVKVGNLQGDQLAILEGLQSGDRIVIAGVQSLTAGMAVHAMPVME